MYAVIFNITMSIFLCDPMPRTAFVVNGIGETLSSIDLETSQVENDIATLGLAPNWICINKDKIYIVNSTSDDIYKIDISNDNILDIIILPDGSNPYAMEFLNDSIAYVSALCVNSVFCINVNTGEIVDTIGVGLSPEGLCISDYKLFVAISSFDPSTWTWGNGMVYVIDTKTNSVLDSVQVGKNPQNLAVDYEGELYAVCTGNYSTTAGSVHRINSKTHEVIDTLPIGGTPISISISQDRKAWIGAGGWIDYGHVYMIDTQTERIIHGNSNPILLGTGVMGVDCDSDGNCYVCSFMEDVVTKLSPDGNNIGVFNVGDGPQSIAIYEPPQGILEIPYPYLKFSVSPNPFCKETHIILESKRDTCRSVHKELSFMVAIYDLSGRLIWHFNNNTYPSYTHTVSWDGTDMMGRELSSGVYLLWIIYGSSAFRERLTIVR